jgi:hypothetical protein
VPYLLTVFSPLVSPQLIVSATKEHGVTHKIWTCIHSVLADLNATFV